uniref:Uncharacterized protein n=1 Tax=Caenorhabditis japonica TaxID=281687 RepID=A0A8R1EB81_CAEJA
MRYLIDSGEATINLNSLYDKISPQGTNAAQQMVAFFTNFFKQITTPAHLIWVNTFRPSCRRASDKHFEALDSSFSDVLIGLSILIDFK